MTPLKFITYALATKRLTRLITQDQVAEPIRDMIHRYTPENTPTYRDPRYLITCNWCSSIWAATALALLNSDTVNTILAASEITGTAENTLERFLV